MSKTIQAIMDSVSELSQRGQITEERAFAAWIAINFFDIDEDEALESATTDGGNDQGIDIIFANEHSQQIVAIQAHYPKKNYNKITEKKKWDAVPAALPFLRSPKKFRELGRGDIAESIENITVKHPYWTYSVGLASFGVESNDIRYSVIAHNTDISTKDTSFFYLSQKDIVGRYELIEDPTRGVKEDTITFAGSIIQDSGEYGNSYVGSITAEELQRLHKTHGDNLFAGNIRLFLGIRKGGINEQIIKTAKEQPGSFWALNNGITLVADSVKISENSSKSKKLIARRFSIVNGCQTTSSLVEAKASKDAKVLARIIAAKKNIRNDIVRYNNSQNAIKIWTVRAADAIHDKLRNELKKVGVDYAPKQEGARLKKHGNIIHLDKIAQFLASKEANLLIAAINNKGELFDEPYQKLFRKDINAQDVFIAWKLGLASEESRQKLQAQLKADNNKGLLNVSSSFWVLHVCFKLLEKFTIQKINGITLNKLKSTECTNAINKYAQKAADIYFESSVDTYDKEEYGTFKATLRSNKFLQKMESKINVKLARMKPKELPDLGLVCAALKS